MGKIAFVFSGQGSQYSGMGKELYDCSPAARAVFDLADTLRPNTSTQCFSAPVEELSITINTQPCLYCVDLAAAQALQEAGVTPDAVAGFSLGELSAITFAGVVSPKDGFSLVCNRAQMMQDATQKHPGRMVAILKLTPQQTEELCAQADGVYPTNYTAPAQLAVAGSNDAIEAFLPRVKLAGGRAIPVAVSGAFHCPHMDGAAAQMSEYLERVEFHAPNIPVYANYNAQTYGDNGKQLVAKQINHPVRWLQIIQRLAADGFDTFIEVGAGKVLCGAIKKIVPDALICNVEDNASLQKTLELLKSR